MIEGHGNRNVLDSVDETHKLTFSVPMMQNPPPQKEVQQRNDGTQVSFDGLAVLILGWGRLERTVLNCGNLDPKP